MYFVRMIDEQGKFVMDAFVDELTQYTIEEPCPAGFYHPKWDGSQWIEGLTQEQIDAIKAQSTPVEPTLEERLQALELLELERLFGGAL